MARNPGPRKRKDKTQAHDKMPVENKPAAPDDPTPEDEFGSGDICSPEPSPSAEDDAPLP